MQTSRCLVSTFSRTLLVSVLLCAPALPQAFGDESRISILARAPLSLPRLTAEAAKLGNKPVDAAAFEVVDVSFERIEPGNTWERAIRHSKRGIIYVSFTVNCSVGTVLDIGGAVLVLAQSNRDPKYAAIHTYNLESGVSHEMPLALYQGYRMASLETVTVKLDQRARTWSIWFRDSLVGSELSLVEATRGPVKFSITAGKAGALLCGVVCSEDNPLFEDDNDNAVPDYFEKEMLGRLVDSSASTTTRIAIQAAWLDERIHLAPSVFISTAPPPDNLPELCAPEGETIHGMPNGLKFGPQKTN